MAVAWVRASPGMVPAPTGRRHPRQNTRASARSRRSPARSPRCLAARRPSRGNVPNASGSWWRCHDRPARCHHNGVSEPLSQPRTIARSPSLTSLNTTAPRKGPVLSGDDELLTLERALPHPRPVPGSAEREEVIFVSHIQDLPRTDEVGLGPRPSVGRERPSAWYDGSLSLHRKKPRWVATRIPLFLARNVIGRSVQPRRRERWRGRSGGHGQDVAELGAHEARVVSPLCPVSVPSGCHDRPSGDSQSIVMGPVSASAFPAISHPAGPYATDRPQTFPAAATLPVQAVRGGQHGLPGRVADPAGRGESARVGSQAFDVAGGRCQRYGNRSNIASLSMSPKIQPVSGA